jgi:hypothetical protein
VKHAYVWIWILAAVMAPSIFAAMRLASGRANAQGSSPLAPAELVMIGSADAQSSKINPTDATTIKPDTNTSFGSLKQIDAGVLNVGYAHCRHIQPHGRSIS